LLKNIEPMDIRRCSKEELDELNRLGREYRERNKPVQSAEPHQECRAILRDMSQEPTIGEQMDLLL